MLFLFFSHQVVSDSEPGYFVHGISQARYWSGLPFSSPRDLSNPGIELAFPVLLLLFSGSVQLFATPWTAACQASLWQADSLPLSKAWKWKVKVKSLSCARLLVTPWTAAYQAPPSMGFSRQEYWSGVPLPSPTVCPGPHYFHLS